MKHDGYLKKLELCNTKTACEEIIDELVLKVIPEEKIYKEKHDLLQRLFKIFQYRMG